MSGTYFAANKILVSKSEIYTEYSNAALISRLYNSPSAEEDFAPGERKRGQTKVKTD